MRENVNVIFTPSINIEVILTCNNELGLFENIMEKVKDL